MDDVRRDGVGCDGGAVAIVNCFSIFMATDILMHGRERDWFGLDMDI